MIGESPRGCPPVMICRLFEGNDARAKEFTSFTVCVKFNQRPEAEYTLARQRGRDAAPQEQNKAEIRALKSFDF